MVKTSSVMSAYIYLVISIEGFVNNTNLTFLAFLYKISIIVSLKNKVGI